MIDRLRTLLPALLLGVAGIVGVAAADDDKKERFLLKRTDSVGERYRGQSVRVLDAQLTQGGKRVGGGKQVVEERSKFVEETLEVREDGTVVSKRMYEQAVRTVHKGGKPETTNTALHGQTLSIVERDGAIAYELAGVGKMQADPSKIPVARIVYLALPADPVAVRDSWEIDVEKVGKAIYGPTFNDTLYDAKGEITVKGLKRHHGEECVRLKLAFGLERAKTQVVAGLAYKIEGEVLFSPALGRILAFDVKGPRSADDLKTNTTTIGTVRITFDAEPLD